MRRWGLALGIGLTLGSAAWATPTFLSTPGQTSDPESPSTLEASLTVEEAGPEDDARVRAFTQAFGPLIDSVTYGAEDVVFALGSRRIHFQEGRMLEEGRLDLRESCDPLFYHYSLEPLTEPPVLENEDPRYCTDVLESLWGRTETEIRRHGRTTTFLDHRMFVNDLVIDALAAVEKEILEVAKRDASVASWIDELDITYSFINREIAGSSTRSHHAWGLAVDLVPSSYEGLQVYWRWSRVFNREGWHQIPVERRWSPPQRVIEIFERRGFIWGGKWPHFDGVHFEYRPEILLYNRLIAEGSE